MGFIKDENDHTGYGVATDGMSATLNSFYDEDAVEITVPEMWNGVPLTKIAFSAFRGAKKLRSVILPDSVKIIDGSAFRGCRRLETAVLSRKLESIGAYAFADNPKLRSITFPSSLDHYHENAFQNCKKLTNLNIYDMNKDGEIKHFVVAALNESRRISYLNATMLYFEAYNMRKYDEGYSVLAEIEDRYNIAEYRLSDPFDLSEFMRNVYTSTIRQYIPRVIRADNVERLTIAGELGAIWEDRIDEYIDIASEEQGHCLAYLLQYQEEHFKRDPFRFDL